MTNKNILLLLWLISFPLFADHVPGHAKLEYGLGLGTINFPDYRGSTHYQTQTFPLPYIRYRGKRLRVEEGVEGRIFETPRLLLALSGNGSLPSADDNPDRQGMAVLETTIELGPSLEYRITETQTTSLWLELPLRFALNVEDNFDSIGSIFHPRLAWRKPALGKYDWKLGMTGGPLYADENYNGYYYNVKDSEVTPTREAFTAGDGYAGYRFDFTFSRRIQKTWFGGFVRYDSLSGSDLEDSSLVTTSSNWTAGLGLSWVFSED